LFAYTSSPTEEARAAEEEAHAVEAQWDLLSTFVMHQAEGLDAASRKILANANGLDDPAYAEVSVRLALLSLSLFKLWLVAFVDLFFIVFLPRVFILISFLCSSSSFLSRFFAPHSSS